MLAGRLSYFFVLVSVLCGGLRAEASAEQCWQVFSAAEPSRAQDTSPVWLEVRGNPVRAFDKPLPRSGIMFRFGLFARERNETRFQALKRVLRGRAPIIPFADETRLYQRFFGNRVRVFDYHRLSDSRNELATYNHPDLPQLPSRILNRIQNILHYLHSTDPANPSILFSLDDYRLPRNLLREPPFYIGPSRYTDQEISIILLNPHYFRLVRWFENNRELTPEQVRRKFQRTAPWLFDPSIEPPDPIFEYRVPPNYTPGLADLFEPYEGQLFRIGR